MNRVRVYSASWCGPCKVLKSQVLPQLEAEGWMVELVDIDSPEGQEESQKLGIRGIPTSMVYKDDELIKTFVGSTTKTQFDGVIS